MMFSMNKLSLTLLLLVIAVDQSSSYCCRNFNFPPNCHFYQELSDGAPTTADTSNVQWISALTPSYAIPGSHPCKRQGVLKVMAPPGTTKVNVHIALCNVSGWSFNIGDKDSNDGFGGDADGNSCGWAAEVHNFDERLYAYENVAWKPVGPPVALNQLPEYFDAGDSTTFLLQSDRCNRVKMQTYNPYLKGSVFEMRDDHMFAFDDLYVGLNRVIRSNYRNGVGACAVCINFDTTPMSCVNTAGSDYCDKCNGQDLCASTDSNGPPGGLLRDAGSMPISINI